MSFSSNPYGALDQLFDFDMTMAANGFNNNNNGNSSSGSSNHNHPTSLTYSPETASLLAPGVYNPTGAVRGGANDLSSHSNNNSTYHHHRQHHLHHHSSAPHHTLITATNANNNINNSSNSSSPTAATTTSPFATMGGPQQPYYTNNGNALGNNNNAFHNNNNNNNNANLGGGMYGGAGNSSAAAAAAAAANTALRQMAAAAFEPIPMRQAPAPAQQHQRHERNPLEDLFMIGAGAYLNPTSVPATVNSFDPMTSLSDALFGMHHGNVAAPPSAPIEEEWMKEISLSVPSLSLEPISGGEVVRRIKSSMDDVIRRYIPCVDFLVQCQQELRKGLAAAQIRPTGRRYRQNGMSPTKFWQTYIENLPQRFSLTNQRRMDNAALQEAMQGLNKLSSDAKQVVSQGCEAVKNSFLGGMKEGESWGLRKWLSKNGNALRVCTDLECILRACKELDKSLDTTKKLAKLLRPLAKETLDRLKKDVPPSYQERSSAHPYLPFFHRLEGALRNMSQFDPEDDGVICLDDSDDDDDDDPIIVVEPPPKRKPPTRKRKAESQTIAVDATAAAAIPPPQPQKRVFDNNDAAEIFGERKQEAVGAQEETTVPAVTATTTLADDDASSSGESEVDSVIQIVNQAIANDNLAFTEAVDGAGWRCTNCAHKNSSSSLDRCQGCGEPSYNSDLVGTLFNPPGFGDDLDLNSVDRSSDGYAELAAAITKRPKKKRRTSAINEVSHRFPLQATQEQLNASMGLAHSLASKAERLAEMFENMDESDLPAPMIRARKGQSLWNDLYSTALRILSELLRQPDAVHFVEPINEEDLRMTGHPLYSSIIKNPLCFRDILATLIDLEHMDEDHSGCYKWLNGILPRRSLSQWNMWRGSDLLQAVDLIFLNSLAYGKICGEGRSRNRSRTNDLRKQLWNQIHETVNACVEDQEERKRSTPTRRSETSGFVVEKKKVR